MIDRTLAAKKSDCFTALLTIRDMSVLADVCSGLWIMEMGRTRSPTVGVAGLNSI